MCREHSENNFMDKNTQQPSADQGAAVLVGTGDLLGGFEFLRVEVTRTQSTELYLKVPNGWRPRGRDYKILGKAAKETTDRSDWDDYQWENTVEMQSCSVCQEKEATQFRLYEVKPEASSSPSPNVRNLPADEKRHD
jgi:hypothetical protein